MKYHFKLHKERNGYWAECLELEGCFAQGDSREDLNENMRKSLNLYIEEPEDSKDLFSLPDPSIRLSKNIVEVALDPQIAFTFMVRRLRLKHGLSQKEAAKKLGFDNVYSYQRLEARRCNPSLATLSKLNELFPEFSIDSLLPFDSRRRSSQKRING